MTSKELGQPQKTDPRFFYGYIVVTVAFLVMLVSWGLYSVFGVFFTPLLTEFGWTRAMTSGAFSLSTILTGLIGIVMGGLTDRLGSRLVMTLCGFLLGLGYLLMSQVSSIWQLYLFYGVIIGIGMGGVWVPLVSTVARWFVKRRGMMTGVILSGVGIGILIMSPVASWLISIYDWRISYRIVGGLVLVVGVLAAQFLRRDPAQMGQVPYGEEESEEQTLDLDVTGFSLGEAVRIRQFWLFFTLLTCFGFCTLATMVHIVAHAIELGISPTIAATILATVGFVEIVGKIVLGSVGDRIGNKQVFIICFILFFAAFLWLVIAKELWMLYLFAVAFGLARGGMAVIQSPLVAELFGMRSHGLMLGVASFGFTIGAAIGPFLTGYIFDITGSYQLAFMVCGALSVVGLILTMLLTPIRGERSKV